MCGLLCEVEVEPLGQRRVILLSVVVDPSAKILPAIDISTKNGSEVFSRGRRRSEHLKKIFVARVTDQQTRNTPPAIPWVDQGMAGSERRGLSCTVLGERYQREKKIRL